MIDRTEAERLAFILKTHSGNLLVKTCDLCLLSLEIARLQQECDYQTEMIAVAARDCARLTQERDAVEMGVAADKEIARLKAPVAVALAAARAQGIAQGRAEMREMAARLARGEVYKETYRTWPWFGDGNSARDSNRVMFCDALATAIRALPTTTAQEDKSAT